LIPLQWDKFVKEVENASKSSLDLETIGETALENVEEENIA